MEFLRDNPGELDGVTNVDDGTQAADPRGRLERPEEKSRTLGVSLREYIKNLLNLNGFRRPNNTTGSGWYRDRFNRIHVNN